MKTVLQFALAFFYVTSSCVITHDAASVVADKVEYSASLGLETEVSEDSSQIYPNFPFHRANPKTALDLLFIGSDAVRLSPPAIKVGSFCCPAGSLSPFSTFKNLIPRAPPIF